MLNNPTHRLSLIGEGTGNRFRLASLASACGDPANYFPLAAFGHSGGSKQPQAVQCSLRLTLLLRLPFADQLFPGYPIAFGKPFVVLP